LNVENADASDCWDGRLRAQVVLRVGRQGQRTGAEGCFKALGRRGADASVKDVNSLQRFWASSFSDQLDFFFEDVHHVNGGATERCPRCQRPMGMSSDLRMLILKSLKLIDRELSSRPNKFTGIGKVTPHANNAGNN
jgi:hypothetical protein